MIPSDMGRMSPMERAKVNGGFVSHRSNRMANQMQEQSMPDDDSKPPNLRDSGGMSDQMCGTCGSFDEGQESGQAGCKKFGGYPCLESEVCDAYEPVGEGSEPAGSEMPMESAEYK